MSEKPLTNQELIEQARKEITANHVEIETVCELVDRLRWAEIKIKQIIELFKSS